MKWKLLKAQIPLGIGQLPPLDGGVDLMNCSKIVGRHVHVSLCLESALVGVGLTQIYTWTRMCCKLDIAFFIGVLRPHTHTHTQTCTCWNTQVEEEDKDKHTYAHTETHTHLEVLLLVTMGHICSIKPAFLIPIGNTWKQL